MCYDKRVTQTVDLKQDTFFRYIILYLHVPETHLSGMKQLTSSLHGFKMEIVAEFPPVVNSVIFIVTPSNSTDSPTEFKVAVSIDESLDGAPRTRITPSPEDIAVFTK